MFQKRKKKRVRFPPPPHKLDKTVDGATKEMYINETQIGHDVKKWETVVYMSWQKLQVGGASLISRWQSVNLVCIMWICTNKTSVSLFGRQSHSFKLAWMLWSILDVWRSNCFSHSNVACFLLNCQQGHYP